MSHIHPPKALFIQISMIMHQCHFKSAIYLSKLFFKMTTFTVINIENNVGIQHNTIHTVLFRTKITEIVVVVIVT